MRLANALLLVSAAVFAGIGIAYLVAPGVMLAIVGMETAPTSDFLLRTEGVALLAGAGLTYAAMQSGGRTIRIALVALGGYYVLGSLVDLAAFANEIVGPASVPSVVVRLAFGGLCLYAAMIYPTRAANA